MQKNGTSYTEEYKIGVAAEFLKSGMLMQDFAAKKGIDRNTLTRWLKIAQQKNVKTEKPAPPATSIKTLFLDIETAPALVYSYGRYKQNICPDQVVHNGFIMCYQYAWDNEAINTESIRHLSPPLLPSDDKELLIGLTKLINSADVVVAHNAVRFDLSRISARLTSHNLPPFAPPYVVDTLRACRRFFKFEANSLDSVCQELGLGRKFHSGGFENAVKCINGDQQAWDKLLEYGEHDVRLLRDLYYRIRPRISNAPNQNLYVNGAMTVCHSCGSHHIKWQGFRRTGTMQYHRYQCKDCGAWGQERRNCLDKEKRETVTKGYGV